MGNLLGTKIIDGDGIFNVSEMENFMNFVMSFDSHVVVSIIGPQGSGKSTLLDHLFNTNFRQIDASTGRSQTTKGIWIAMCLHIQPCTVVLDFEGSNGQGQGKDDTAFEKQSALFALAVSDIVLINMWCHDIGQKHTANKPLLKTVFKAIMRLFSPRKTTLLFVIRDKTMTLEDLEPILREDIQKIWDSIRKPHELKDTPLSEFFNVEVVSLSSFEEKEQQFKEEVENLRRRFENSIAPGGLAGDRRGVVPASEFSSRAQHIWKVIKEDEDLDLPNRKVVVATMHCEEIADEKIASFLDNEEWCHLEKAAQSGVVPGFGKKLSSMLDNYFIEYDMEAIYFDDGVRTSKRKQLESKLLQLVHPAYKSMLRNLRSKTMEDFRAAFEMALERGEGFAAAAYDCTQSCMSKFDEACKDAAIEQADWNTAKAREKVWWDVNAHVASVREAKLSELAFLYEEKLKKALAEPVEALLDALSDDTWSAIRRLLVRETSSALSEFDSLRSSFDVEQATVNKLVAKLEQYAKNFVESKAREEARRVLIRMKDRFSNLFSYDSESKPRMWTGKEDIKAIKKSAYASSLKLLSVMAAIRVDDEDDNIENTLSLAFMDASNGSSTNTSIQSFDLLVSSSWNDVPANRTLITPAQCKSLWTQFKAETEYIVAQAIAMQEANKKTNNWLPPAWAIVAMVILLSSRNPVCLGVLLVTFLLGEVLWVQLNVPGKFQQGALPRLLSLYTKFLPTIVNLLKRLPKRKQRPSTPEAGRTLELGSDSSTSHSQSSSASSVASSEVSSSYNSVELTSPVKQQPE